MEVHFYTSVHLSSRVGGGLMLRLVMSPDTASPLHFATELLGGGYLIFERMSDAAVGVGAVYEAVRAVEDLDPGCSTLLFNPTPRRGGASGAALDEMRATFDKMHEDRHKVGQIVASLLGSAPKREDWLDLDDSTRPHAIYLMEMRMLVERRISGMISESEFRQQAAALINAGLMSPPEQRS